MNLKLKLGSIYLDTSGEVGQALQSTGYVAVVVKSGNESTVLHLRSRYKDSYLNRWVDCPYPQATNVFISYGPRVRGFRNKVGTYYPQSGYLYIATDEATKFHVEAAVAVLNDVDVSGASGHTEITLASTNPERSVLVENPANSRRIKVRPNLSAEAARALQDLYPDRS